MLKWIFLKKTLVHVGYQHGTPTIIVLYDVYQCLVMIEVIQTFLMTLQYG